MSLKLLQAGSGASRDFALLYLVGDVGPKLAQALGPDACVVNLPRQKAGASQRPYGR